jgi:hypothetical protein
LDRSDQNFCWLQNPAIFPLALSHQNEKQQKTKNEKGNSHQPINEFQTTRTGGKKGQLPLPRCTDSWYEFTLSPPHSVGHGLFVHANSSSKIKKKKQSLFSPKPPKPHV